MNESIQIEKKQSSRPVKNGAVVPYPMDQYLFHQIRLQDRRGKTAKVSNQQLSAHCQQFSALPKQVKRIVRSSAVTAELIGCKPYLVERVRTILDHGNEAIWSELESGSITIEAAYRKAITQKSLSRDTDKPNLPEAIASFIRGGRLGRSFHQPLAGDEKALLWELVQVLQRYNLIGFPEVEVLKDLLTPKNWGSIK